MGLVNKSCEDFQLPFKCLIYVAGLTSPADLDIRTKLLSKLDTQDDSITLENLSDEYDRLVNLKKDSAMIQNTKNDESILVNQITKANDFDSNNQVISEHNSQNSINENIDSCFY